MLPMKTPLSLKCSNTKDDRNLIAKDTKNISDYHGPRISTTLYNSSAGRYNTVVRLRLFIRLKNVFFSMQMISNL